LRAAAALLLLAAPAFAQTWPSKQVRIVVGGRR
jgi:tripartite-type tricarboxylate transporter receptor subunit TctC